MNMGWVELSIRLTSVFSGAGQPDSGPSGVADQSKARIRPAISPAPLRKPASDTDGTFQHKFGESPASLTGRESIWLRSDNTAASDCREGVTTGIVGLARPGVN